MEVNPAAAPYFRANWTSDRGKNSKCQKAQGSPKKKDRQIESVPRLFAMPVRTRPHFREQRLFELISGVLENIKRDAAARNPAASGVA